VTADVVSVEDIGRLTPAQRHTLGIICIGRQPHGRQRSAESLVARGLVEKGEVVLPGRFPVTIWVYQPASIAVHMAWCEWCSLHVRDEDEEDEEP
jgi:hypothetical protein